MHATLRCNFTESPCRTIISMLEPLDKSLKKILLQSIVQCENEAAEKDLMDRNNDNSDAAMEDPNMHKDVEIIETANQENENDDLSVSSDTTWKISNNTVLTNDNEENSRKINYLWNIMS